MAAAGLHLQPSDGAIVRRDATLGNQMVRPLSHPQKGSAALLIPVLLQSRLRKVVRDYSLSSKRPPITETRTAPPPTATERGKGTCKQLLARRLWRPHRPK